MDKMSKTECYSKLFKMKNNGVDVTDKILYLASCSEVPTDLIEFVTPRSPEVPVPAKDLFIEDLRTKCNNKKSKLYKEIFNDHDPVESVKILSSLITQSSIYGSSNYKELSESLDLSKTLSAITSYINSNDDKCLNEEFIRLRNLFKDSVKDDDNNG